MAGLLACGPLQHGEGEQQHALEAQFAILRRVPLGLGVRAASLAARAHRQRGYAKRERDVGVGGAEAQIGAQAQMTVHGAQCFEQRRVGGQAGGGAVADLFDGECERPAQARRVGAGLCVGAIDGVFNGAVQCDLKAQQLLGTGGAEVDGSRGRLWNGIDAGAALQTVPMLSVVRGSSGSGVTARAASAEASAAMGLGVPASVKLWPPGPAMRTLVSAAAERLGDGGFRARAIENNMRGDAAGQRCVCL